MVSLLILEALGYWLINIKIKAIPFSYFVQIIVTKESNFAALIKLSQLIEEVTHEQNLSRTSTSTALL